ncbi:ATP-binding protein [Anaeromicropila herbilytica]|uniref:histidine kinase n=1 Tax=Anaeromicropila herbilytica TaxID=2785025 RepID=A0A7R7EQI6_9FIRM|nr:ATP-binding protein [Anaeromicropila herbilytica]BCN32926.1 hypothetical protein bsdtb5_42210 [Anaeromicropila herbilytica]
MLTQEELLKIEQLSACYPDVDKIIKRLNEENKFMLSKISHEIRNPLTLISSTLQLMESKNPELTSIKYWSQIRRDVNDVVLLLNELSTFNNCEKLTLSPVNLSTLIHDIADSFESSSNELDHNISVSIPESALNYMRSYPCDKLKIKQVFLNIMRNAFEAMNAGDSLSVNVALSDSTIDSTPELSIASLENSQSELDDFDESELVDEGDDSSLIITISNNGEPIPPEHLDTLFDAFVTHKSSGTGLGLAISDKIIKAHGGTISVESNEDHTDFTIKLPIHIK